MRHDKIKSHYSASSVATSTVTTTKALAIADLDLMANLIYFDIRSDIISR